MSITSRVIDAKLVNFTTVATPDASASATSAVHSVIVSVKIAACTTVLTRVIVTRVDDLGLALVAFVCVRARASCNADTVGATAAVLAVTVADVRRARAIH
jgi:hypothetical protein